MLARELRGRVLLVGMALLAMGCVRVQTTMLPGAVQATRVFQPYAVHVLLADDEEPEDCARVAVLHGSGSSSFTDESGMLSKLRQKAGELGANALRLEGMREPSSGERIANALIGGFNDGQRRSEALALYCPSLIPEPATGTDTLVAFLSGHSWHHHCHFRP